MEDKNFIKGTIYKQIYRNEMNGYTVSLFKIKDNNVDYEDNIINITGILPILNEKKEYMEIIDNFYHGMRIHDDYDHDKHEAILNQIGEYFYNFVDITSDNKDLESIYKTVFRSAFNGEKTEYYEVYTFKIDDALASEIIIKKERE